MDPRDFSFPSGALVKTVKGNPAFSPDTLPPALEFERDIVALLSKADTALAELSATGRHLPNPHLLIEPYVRREAVLSSRIEGTQTTLAELLLEEVREGAQDRNKADLAEVRNYVTALEHGIQLLGKLPLSLRLVRELHRDLMKGVRGANKTPGEFRTGQNIVGATGQDEVTASYVPPPVEKMKVALAEWEKYLNNDDGLPTLIQCALQHVQFESIHPFWDGNGRVGRLLITLFLISKGRLSQPLLYLSGFFDEHRQDYYDLLQRTRTRSEWGNWMRFFLTGVIETASEAASQANELVQIREDYRQKMKSKAKALALIDHLLTNPYITVARAQRLLEVSQPTARSAILALEDAKIIVNRSGRSWGGFYVAKEILDAIDVRPTVTGASKDPRARARP
jgi:Fic family protein